MLAIRKFSRIVTTHRILKYQVEKKIGFVKYGKPYIIWDIQCRLWLRKLYPFHEVYLKAMPPSELYYLN